MLKNTSWIAVCMVVVIWIATQFWETTFGILTPRGSFFVFMTEGSAGAGYSPLTINSQFTPVFDCVSSDPTSPRAFTGVFRIGRVPDHSHKIIAMPMWLVTLIVAASTFSFKGLAHRFIQED